MTRLMMVRPVRLAFPLRRLSFVSRTGNQAERV